MASEPTDFLSKEKIQDAIKKASAKTKEDVYLKFQFDGRFSLIFPHKAGMQFMEALAEAMVYTNEWASPPTYKQPTDEIYISAMSNKQIIDIKGALLLGISEYAFRKAQETSP